MLQATNRSNIARTRVRPFAALLLGGRHHLLDHRAGQALAGQWRHVAAVHAHMQAVTCAFQMRAIIRAVESAASPAAVPVRGSSSFGWPWRASQTAQKAKG